MAGVTGVTSGDYTLPDKTRTPKKELDQNDFLILMMEQLKNQDPLEPQSNEEFIAQMAQFTSLQTLTELNRFTQFSQASQLIGKQVTVNDNDTVITGVVEKAAIVDDMVKVYIDDQGYDLKKVIQVENVEE
ncbi:flagellar basal-body rod modification protein FlgD [Desulfocucumis palustris]|uniref:Flagellar basal-body rod modification protein FlgD n=1 Tax=Desulfocucumis palustris TaxID=1898651 RepID=A0A2L2XB32_9FIRM|nr:flagellar hook capping FlgD N-terminal domain-containing protein [Desulfocucumis palustris]GBF33194.1 flagellar basal-body rod modification protein FlgD [Desulfocucumis palustris]